MNTLLRERTINHEICKAQSALIAVSGEDTAAIVRAISAYEKTLRNSDNPQYMTQRIIDKLNTWKAQHDATGVWYRLSLIGMARAFETALAEGLTDRNAYELREIIHSLNRADSFEEISE